MLGDAGPDVVDVGAGTGKLSCAVRATGRTVIAVDPDAVMLAALSARKPLIPTLETAAYSWTRQLTGEQLVELVTSCRSAITASAAERAAIRAQVHELADRVSNGHGLLQMPYVTHVVRVANSR